jgi:SAM-dependent methyltransferase
MGQDLSKHPGYCTEEAVRQGTQWHLDQGHTVFQLFQFPGGEQAHSNVLLSTLRLPENAKVLSLGSGVGGMERYWQLSRPDLSFELVNVTPTQLEMCLCEGEHVQADAEGYVSENGPFDCVLIAYTLGHVGVLETLASALENVKPGGVLVLYDVFDTSNRFDSTLYYDAPKRREVEAFAVESNLRFRTVVQGGIPPVEYAAFTLPWIVDEAVPCLFVLEKAAHVDL